MGELRIYSKLYWALTEGNVTGYHYRCGGEVRIDEEGIICDVCGRGLGAPIPELDDKDNLITTDGVVRICFEK